MLGFKEPEDKPRALIRKRQIYRYDRTTERNSNFRHISIQLQDPGLGDVSKNQAKYKGFSGFLSLGLFLVFMGIGFSVPSATVQARTFSYFGSKNDKISLWGSKVEAQNSQTIAFLEAATNFDPNPAKGGGDITIVDDSALLPDSGPSGTIADVESNEHQGKVSLYVVREGDTLPQIAKMFGVNTNTILWANDLGRNSALRTGQTLVILPVSGVQHTVQKG